MRTRFPQRAPRAALALAWLCLPLLATACGDDEDGPSDTSPDVQADTGDVGDDTDTAPIDTVDDSSDTPPDSIDPPDTSDATPDGSDPPDTAPDVVDPDPRNPDCDPLNELECAFPWPSSLYLEADSSRVTGYTLAFGATTLPANFQGIQVDPTPYRRMDGFNVSTPILVHFANLDVSGLPHEQNLEISLEEDAAILLFEVTDEGLTRVPYWVDLDDWERNAERKTLYVRPGVVLEENTRYVVAMRDLVDTSGAPVTVSSAFAALRDGTAASDTLLAPRVARFEEMFGLLDDAGVARSGLQLAWDFHTASSEAIHGPMLHMRRDGLARVGENGPAIVINNVVENTPEQNAYWAYVLRGHIEVPDYMKPNTIEGGGGSITGYDFNLGDDGLPTPFGTRNAEFWIGIPHSAMDGTPHGLVQSGHGFFGLADETVGSWTHNGQLANQEKVIFFGCNWTGMAEDDFGTTQFLVFNFNHFPWLSDRIHQGILEFILFARAMKMQFADLAWVTDREIEVDASQMYYLGISQGGIFGATYMALAPDIERGHLGVPGANYSLMEHRSRNFSDFFDALAGAYSGRSKQAVLLSAAQILWDQTDPVSYWRHLSAAPFEDGPPRYVIAAPSKGDQQVTTVSMEVIARTPGVGLAVMENYDFERSVPLTEEQAYPHTGSGLVLFNFGHEWPAPGVNRPAVPTPGAPDAHNAPRRNAAHNEQMFHFFRTGEIINTCGDNGCVFLP